MSWTNNARIINEESFETAADIPVSKPDNVVHLSKARVKNALNINDIPDLSELENANKWMKINYDTVRKIFAKYPQLNLETFKSYFFSWYNKIILISSPETIDLIDLEQLKPWDDIIEHILEKVKMSEGEFKEKTKWKLDFLTFPNMSELSVAQKYFYEKIKDAMPTTEIVFW